LEVLAALERLGYRVVRQEHSGLAAARNAGAAAARGELLLPLDADDRLRPDFPLAARQLLARESDVGVVYCDYWEFGLRTGTVQAPEFDLPRLLRGNYVTACACLRRRVWEECGGWDEGLPAWEDWDLWISAAGRGWRFHRLPAVGFDYRRRPGSMVTALVREEAGTPLQERIVRKHTAIYLRHLPDLVRETQEAVRVAEAARREAAEASSRREAAELEAALARRERDEARGREAEAVRDLEALRGELAASVQQVTEVVADRERIAGRVGELEAERDRLYRELAAWHERVAAMEGTRAWRLRGRLLALRRGAAAALARRRPG
ncbi:MAG: glycosyltransferase, partial [Thermoanaerobaculia bacterium]